MARYFFDIRDNDGLALDEEGLNLKDIDAVQEEAARTMADMARDELRGRGGHLKRSMAVEVRDSDGPVLEVQFTFQIIRKRDMH